MKAIEITGLTKYYGSSRGVDGISLSVDAGSFFGFIGPNGAGKSTTIRTLLGLIRPTCGTVSVLGLDVLRDRQSILSRTGYLPSEISFWPGMRVQDVLNFSADLRKKDCRTAASQLCDRLQLNPRQKVDSLSLGNRKKVAIVCALQHAPELLILDEPTSGLDPLMQREFFSILREQNQTGGVTIFLSSHVLSEVQHHCSQAAVLREGKIIVSGTVADLARTNARRVRFQGSAPLDLLPQVRDLHQTSFGTDFLYSGSMDILLSVLAQGSLSDLTISEPDLEEVFLHYYAEADTGAAGAAVAASASSAAGAGASEGGASA